MENMKNKLQLIFGDWSLGCKRRKFSLYFFLQNRWTGIFLCQGKRVALPDSYAGFLAGADR